MNQSAVTIYQAGLPAAVSDEIIDDAADGVTFCKALDSEDFLIGGTETYESLRGQVVAVTPFWGKFVANEMVKWQNEGAPPEEEQSRKDRPNGYSKRADVDILCADGLEYRISMAPSSYQRSFARQQKRLRAIGEDICNFICEFTVKNVQGQSGLFPFVITKVLHKVNELSTPEPITEEAVQDVPDEDIPF